MRTRSLDSTIMSLPRAGVVILAAGGSTKLGRPKQLVQFKGKSLLRRSVESAMKCELQCVIAVLGSRSDEISGELEGLSVETVRNEDWNSGISTSIKTGLSKLLELHPGINAVIIMLSDQPFVDETTVRGLFKMYCESGMPIVASEYNGVLGVPALFDRAMFDKLMALEGDEGARVIIRKYSSDKVASVPAPEAEFDVDTPDDQERLLQWNDA